MITESEMRQLHGRIYNLYQENDPDYIVRRSLTGHLVSNEIWTWGVSVSALSGPYVDKRVKKIQERRAKFAKSRHGIGSVCVGGCLHTGIGRVHLQRDDMPLP